VVIKLPPPSNSAIRRDRKTIPVSTPMFLGVNFLMAPSETLSDETGSQKSKMAAEKTECFRHRATRLDYSEKCSMCGKGRNQSWQQKDEASLITQEVLYGFHLEYVSMTQRHSAVV